MGRKRFDQMDCSVAQALDVLGDWWTLLIVRDAFMGSKRFGEFESSQGIAKNVLTDRLGQLVEHGIFERVPTSPQQRRCEYRLTDKGHALLPVITSLRQWADRWIYGEGEEPMVVVDRELGEPVQQLTLTSRDGRPLRSSDLRVQPGPGASPELRELLQRVARPEREATS